MEWLRRLLDRDMCSDCGNKWAMDGYMQCNDCWTGVNIVPGHCIKKNIIKKEKNEMIYETRYETRLEFIRRKINNLDLPVQGESSLDDMDLFFLNIKNILVDIVNQLEDMSNPQIVYKSDIPKGNHYPTDDGMPIIDREKLLDALGMSFKDGKLSYKEKEKTIDKKVNINS